MKSKVGSNFSLKRNGSKQMKNDESNVCLLRLLRRASGGNDGKLTLVKIEIMSNESDCVHCLVRHVVALCFFLS